MYELYSKSNIRNPVLSSQIHGIILSLFIEEYYPLQSRNIKLDSKTMPVIMGGYAFNMNIPKKMNKMLYYETDDIDIKVYTTEINNIVKQSAKLEKVLSILKYINILICFYMKQILKEIIEYSRIIIEPTEPYKKRTIKNLSKSITKSRTKSKTKNKSNTKSKTNQNGGNYILNTSHLIKVKQRRFGVLKSCKIKIILTKKGQEKEIFDITDLSYIDTYKLIMKKIVDPDVLIKTKISYSIKYINLIIPYSNKSIPSISFSDTKIIYPNIHK
jgi:hypothetical protein